MVDSHCSSWIKRRVGPVPGAGPSPPGASGWTQSSDVGESGPDMVLKTRYERPLASVKTPGSRVPPSPGRHTSGPDESSVYGPATALDVATEMQWVSVATSKVP